MKFETVEEFLKRGGRVQKVDNSKLPYKDDKFNVQQEWRTFGPPVVNAATGKVTHTRVRIRK